MTQRLPPCFLASVRSVSEAILCARAGADVIDCKDPNLGSLGALPFDVVGAIRRTVGPGIPVSATVGDVVADAIQLPALAARMAGTGVDIVKIGFFPGGNAAGAIRALAPLTRRVALVGLLLADRAPDLSLVALMAEAGFAGVMLDTAGKAGGALPEVMARERIAAFVNTAHDAGLFAGLAGSLRLQHIAALSELDPDILGFRGALCRNGARTSELDRSAVGAVRDAMVSTSNIHARLRLPCPVAVAAR